MVAAVETSRRIYQRMLTYTLNKIIKTFEIALFLSVGLMLTGDFVITPATDRALAVHQRFRHDVDCHRSRDVFPQPDRWRIRPLMLTGGSRWAR